MSNISEVKEVQEKCYICSRPATKKVKLKGFKEGEFIEWFYCDVCYEHEENSLKQWKPDYELKDGTPVMQGCFDCRGCPQEGGCEFCGGIVKNKEEFEEYVKRVEGGQKLEEIKV